MAGLEIGMGAAAIAPRGRTFFFFFFFFDVSDDFAGVAGVVSWTGFVTFGVSAIMVDV